ncbi:AIPR family protein [Sphingomonas sp.]|uniref:AIPR family protein n=1 Tax=Sphingomonas sp. TaxID=28214 RepID=UPI0025F64D65|nr:AIPR family protein [Sphingomonas sp.]MBV9528894.1 AIPR family protein [Sphingomonas sp.]
MARQPHNSQTILREYVEQQRQERDPDSDFNDFFEFFTAQLLLRDHSLSEDEISEGILGGGSDGGIDSMYIFVDEVLVAEDTDLTIAKTGSRVRVEIIQSKTERTFSEDAINRWKAVTESLFSLNVGVDDFSDVYNDDVRAAFQLFRNTYRALLRKAPTLHISYHYATFRPPNPISAGINGRIRALSASARERFPDASVDVELLGAADLWDRIIHQPRHVRTLATERASSGRNGYICLVSLGQIDAFLRDENGVATHNIFDENVRDWQGLTAVNAKIAEELEEGGDRDFWWLNNGVTIICTEYRNDDNNLTVTNPQIVNGLQTCKEISQHFDGLSAEDRASDPRFVLVKVIRIADEDTRDRVIRATNSQNPVSVAMLRATDPFQRTIEHYLLARDFYYERRKNFYANRGRPSSKIVSLTFMAQSALAMFSFKPDDARARPSNPLKRDTEYRALFNHDVPLNAYFMAVYVCRFVELYMKRHLALDAKEINNLRFYVGMVTGWLVSERCEIDAAATGQLETDDITGEIVQQAYDFVRASYQRLGGDDDAARGSLLKARLQRRMKRDLAAR